jgi:hypothetical protein
VPHPNDQPRPTDVLPGGETLTLDGSTIADPETGARVPAAVLRLPPWRLQELAAALTTWARIQTLVLADGAHFPTEAPLAARLTAAAQIVGGGHRPF